VAVISDSKGNYLKQQVVRVEDRAIYWWKNVNLQFGYWFTKSINCLNRFVITAMASLVSVNAKDMYTLLKDIINFNLLSDGIHPSPLLAKVWLKEISENKRRLLSINNN
jgi:hypothetical protein